ncbi:MAG: YmfQ family protein [Spirochaetaceae bacterium]|jgi:hypothetical protein|nr:YmfQ family protein [Spirochaetaceae bacterium]
MKTLSTQTINALLPEGAAWKPRRNGTLEKLYTGIGDFWDTIIAAGENLSNLRNPQKIPEELLPDLEKDFGINPRIYLDIQNRRNSLMSKVYSQRSISTFTKLQNKLNLSGFGKDGYGLIAIPNQSPAANPEHLRATAPRAYYLGNEIRFSSTIKLEGANDMICGNATACCGFYTGYEGDVVEFFTPPAQYWPAIFLIGGQVLSRNEDGSIREIEVIQLPQFRKAELHKLILETKPIGTWALIFATYSTI